MSREAAAARFVVPPGTDLWRVRHRLDPAARLTGVVAVSESERTALAEYLRPGLRDVRPSLDGLVLSRVRMTTELVLLRLFGTLDLARASLRTDLLSLAPNGWVDAYRDELSGFSGMIWHSHVDLNQPTMLLFGTNCPDNALVECGPARQLDTPAGIAYVNREMASYGVRIPEPAGEPVVFINYRSSDDKLAVDLLDREFCRRFGASCVFRDDRSLTAGMDFAAELLDKVRGARVLIVVIGERWEKVYNSAGQRLLDRDSDWVRREIVEAHKHGVSVVPLLVGARGKLDPDALPPDIDWLAGRQFRHLPYGYGEADVRAVVDRLIGEVPALGEWQ